MKKLHQQTLVFFKPDTISRGILGEIITRFIQKTPVILMVLGGLEAIKVVRNLAGPTFGVDALAGTIRGDYSIFNNQILK
ncbi:hypothetical protein COY43_02425 [Candidatus Berkelbacteria bacterium CG_4_10_14_0_8_um_filter_35_9_33_8]|uniref:nucleoside-diphosphate kinase n=1 Tax=Candidatus Berkelbacteria bacterium CG_4_10_14_0_2_um_filter_35_9_33_12 TaxID=1974499 RepID=A0A2M7W478_9BACT|nr:MAG: hypothetical protein COX10_01820 [Candidatus Berkelbacteria bacterium CG23_combo_of_CG06-09_8_20_14_all_33_15]PIS08158.1 MAG: hypothetical protein COT76_02975 [Candidatus Berkelbacteria bacterium CG10_big_fil_rev_8_21_14_0_10_33_10]PIZ28079.1 MAG: hypothetical protein COY43_02425 [Candidatus Berkelbacteria bacterium CG_4_10_14_0_8_um_filter_35_9_33_8]PJA20471.1 MAG: hypothetical protein COX60_01610 [Candidatus Berkelbacteria bacterium CG_4_10_14_0_2_um_filter_35_9_33_12]